MIDIVSHTLKPAGRQTRTLVGRPRPAADIDPLRPREASAHPATTPPATVQVQAARASRESVATPLNARSRLSTLRALRGVRDLISRQRPTASKHVEAALQLSTARTALQTFPDT